MTSAWLGRVLINSLKPSPENIAVIPSVALAIRLAQPNNYRRLDGAAQHSPNLANVVNTTRLAASVSNDKLLPQSHFLASSNTTLILGDGILSNQLPFGFRFGHGVCSGLTLLLWGKLAA